MDRSRFIAGLIGPTLMVVAVGLYLNRELLPLMVEAVAANYTLIVLAGVATLICGLAIVQSHNVWRGWPAVVTAFGWLAVVGGAMRILFPQFIAQIAPAFVRAGEGVMALEFAVMLLFGLFLTVMAFLPRRAA